MEVLVIDNGEGMQPEVVARCFEPFFSTKGERGTGLGLAMVFGIVERHGGQVSIDSTPGKGTTVRLWLRAGNREVKDEKMGEAQRSRPLSSHLSSPTRHLSILAVDDEVRLGQVIVRALAADGHRVTAATSGEEALERLASTGPVDLLISDVGMGAGMNGWELADAVRARWPDTTIVLATGWGASISAADAAAHGIAAVLPKPYRISELRQIVAAVGARRLPPSPTTNDPAPTT